MYVETYETSNKWILFSNMRFIAMFITAVCALFLIKLRWPKKNKIVFIKDEWKEKKAKGRANV